jgi:NAD(P)-dependent dehydrogenase (short-subunit alcohol dehydrogenase family)
MALALLKAGHRVFLTSTSKATLEETRRISGAGDRAAFATADLAEEESAAQIVKAVEAAFGRIDILVNNAALPNPPARQPIDIQADHMRRLFEVNTFAPINLIRMVLPKMVERSWGRIIFISTSLDTMLEPNHVAYGMTKAAGEAFMVALARSLASTGVTVNVLAPGGAVATRMAADMANAGALLQPDIMREPIVWLASDASDAVSGCRFIAAKWNPALRAEQAAQACGSRAAWSGYGDKSIRPGRLPG